MRRRLPPLRLFAVFESVVRAGGINRAAMELGVTQPAVSQSLKALEAHIGRNLIDRSARPLALTEAGKMLYAVVSNSIDRMGAVVEEIKSQPMERESIVVCCSPCIGTYWLIPRLASFYEKCPATQIKININSAPEMKESSDFSIFYSNSPPNEPDQIILFSEQIVPVCSPHYLAKIGYGKFGNATLIEIEENDALHPDWTDYSRATEIAIEPRERIRFRDYVQGTQAALAGIGVMLGWISNSANLISEGRLVHFYEQKLSPGGAFKISTQKHGELSGTNHILIDHLKQNITMSSAL